MRDDDDASLESKSSKKSFNKEMERLSTQAKQNTDLLKEIVGEKTAKTLQMPDGTLPLESPSK